MFDVISWKIAFGFWYVWCGWFRFKFFSFCTYFSTALPLVHPTAAENHFSNATFVLSRGYLILSLLFFYWFYRVFIWNSCKWFVIVFPKLLFLTEWTRTLMVITSNIVTPLNIEIIINIIYIKHFKILSHFNNVIWFFSGCFKV